MGARKGERERIQRATKGHISSTLCFLPTHHTPSHSSVLCRSFAPSHNVRKNPRVPRGTARVYPGGKPGSSFCSRTPTVSLNSLRSFLFDAQNPLKKVFKLVSLLYKCTYLHAGSTRRIYSDFQGSRDRFRRHGVYWLLGKAHSYSYVSVDDFV